DPIGASVTLEDDWPRTVVGVVRGMRLLGPESEVEPEAYIPYAQLKLHSAVSGSLVLKLSGDAAATVPSVKNAIWAAMPGAVIPDPETFEQLYSGIVAQRKLNML